MESKKIKIYYQDKFEIDGIIWTIKFSSEKAYEKEDDGEEYITFGRTYTKKNTIIIYTDNLIDEHKPILDTLYHEIGHAIWKNMPSHAEFGEATNVFATGMEWASRYSNKINKLYKGYKAGVNK